MNNKNRVVETSEFPKSSTIVTISLLCYLYMDIWECIYVNDSIIGAVKRVFIYNCQRKMSLRNYPFISFNHNVVLSVTKNC